MKIYSAEQIRRADLFTIENEPISSVDLMERAATAAFQWIQNRFTVKTSISVYCGVGNNGGDGLVISRLLFELGYAIQVFEVQFSTNYSNDYQINRGRLLKAGISITEINSEETIFVDEDTEVVIDAIFGSGLSRPVTGWLASLITILNNQLANKIAIDIPSGLFSEDNDSNNGAIFKADYTLTFEFPKLAFIQPSNHQFVGDYQVIAIGIHESFVLNEPTNHFTIEKQIAKLIRYKGSKYDYKNVYGHAMIIAGSYGKMGAAVLAAKSALQAGAGLVTSQIPKCGYDIMQISVPEVMTWTDKSLGYLSELKKIANFSSIGIGPGIGKKPETIRMLEKVMKNYHHPMVFDADALNILSMNPNLLKLVPKNSIFTPHIGEWNRLTREHEGDFERLQSAKNFAKEHTVIVVLKGAHTAVITPSEEVFFNTTGNNGMATAGSGDVLCGILTGLLAQGYTSQEAAILGVYIHGVSGDIALKEGSRESVSATNIIDNLGSAFSSL